VLQSDIVAEFKTSLSQFLSQNCTRDYVRSRLWVEHPGADAQGEDAPAEDTLWRACNDEMGLAASCLPTEFGGDGGDAAVQAAALEELGAALAPVPYLASCVFATELLLRAAPGGARTVYLERIARGDVITVALAEGSDPEWVIPTPSTSAAQVADRFEVTGVKSFVLAGSEARSFVVSATIDGQVKLFLVDADDPGVRVQRADGADLTRPLSFLRLVDAAARELPCESVQDVLDGVRTAAWVALGAEMLGGIDRCVKMAASYARDRYQFGRAIGSFQAIKHACAQMRVKAELARATVSSAVASVGEPRHRVDALVVAATVGRQYRDIASAMLHVHGGLGFTWEHDAHLYLRRALSSSLLLGGDHAPLDDLAAELGWRSSAGVCS